MSVTLTNPNSVVRNKDLERFKSRCDSLYSRTDYASTDTCEAIVDELT